MIQAVTYTLPTGAPELTPEELLTTTMKMAECTFAARGEVLSMFVAVSGREMHLIVTPFRDEEEKVAMLWTLRKAFKDFGVTHYAMVSEAWAALVDPKLEPRWTELPPSKRNNRQEMVTVLVADKTGIIGSAERMIERPFDGSKPRLVPMDETFDAAMSGGRMGALLMEDEP
jgi:hypothetical protein